MNEQIQINKTLKGRIEELQQKNTGIQSELQQAKAAITNFKIEEFTSRIKSLEKDKVDLMAKMKQIETTRLQEEHLKARIDQDCKDLVRANVELRNELDETVLKLSRELDSRQEKKSKTQEQLRLDEQVRNDLSRIQDDFHMLQISMDMKEKQSMELAQSLKNMESSVHKSKCLIWMFVTK